MSFATRLIFDFALRTVLRPSELPQLRLSKVLDENYNGGKCFRVKGLLRSVNETSKTLQGSLKDSEVKPKEVEIFKGHVILRSDFGNKHSVAVNWLATNDKYPTLRRKVTMSADRNDRSFASVSHQSYCEKIWFRADPFGAYKVWELVRNAC